MTNFSVALCACFLLLLSCNNSGKAPDATMNMDTAASHNFFPVTEYLRGEIFNIKSAGINPMKYTTANGATDSAWIKIEQLDSVVSAFTHPEIDSANLNGLFTEKSFLDQSLNAITFTYDPAVPLPDSMKLTHWDVYVDPKTNKVKRIYMVKQVDKSTMQQLTWVDGHWCKITTIITDDKGIMQVAKEEKLIWDF